MPRVNAVGSINIRGIITSQMKTICTLVICAILAFLVNCTEESRFGIFAKNGTEKIPLTDLRFNIRAIDGLTETEIVQTYQNAYPNAIDSYYVFPINYKMAVTNFSITYSNDPELILQGRLMPKKVGREIYENMRDRGHGAAYMEYDGKLLDMLSLELGNIPPGVVVKVRVTFIEQLQVEDLSWAIRIPTTFVPPYHSGSQSPPGAATTPTVNEAPYNMSLNIEIDSSSPITRLVSPSHDIVTKFAFNNKKAWVTLREGKDVPDRDIIVLYRNVLIQKPQLVLQKSALYDSYAVLVSLLPFAEGPLKEGIDTDPRAKYYKPENYLETKAEFVFLIDCSGSMHGRIGQSREAAKLFMKSLPPDSYFSFVFFGSQYKVAAPGHGVKYSKETADFAWTYLDSIGADMGGTELYAALEYTLNLPLISGYKRNVLIMTDGEVSNPENVIKMVSEKTQKSGIFVHSIGIGTGASRHLVQGVAEAGNGASYFLTDDEAIAPKVIEALTNMCGKSIKNMQVKWPNGMEPIVAHVPSNGFYGKPIVALAILPKKPEGKVTVSGYKGEDEYFEEVFDVNSMERKEGEAIYQLAAKMAFNKGGFNNSETVEKLSIQYSVLSERTAFVAVKFYTNQTNRSNVQEVRIPVMSVRESRQSVGAGAAPPMTGLKQGAPTPTRMYAQSVNLNAERQVLMNKVDSAKESKIAAEDTAAPKTKDASVLDLIKLQDPAGWFEHDRDVIAAHLHTSLAKIQEKLSVATKNILSGDIDNRILNTVVMIYILDTEFNGSSEISLIRMRAIAWLSSKGVNCDAMKVEVEKALKMKEDL